MEYSLLFYNKVKSEYILLVFVHKEYWWMSGRQWRGMQRSRDNLLYSLLTDSTSKIPNLFTIIKAN